MRALGAIRTRTTDVLNVGPLPLGYEGEELRAEDSNPQPPGSEPGVLPDCTSPHRDRRGGGLAGRSTARNGRPPMPGGLGLGYRQVRRTGAAGRDRTGGLHLGKVALCLLSYNRVVLAIRRPDSNWPPLSYRDSASRRDRTGDLALFRRALNLPSSEGVTVLNGRPGGTLPCSCRVPGEI